MLPCSGFPHCLPPLLRTAVEYEDRRDAEDAIRGLDGHEGWRVEFARAPGPKSRGPGGYDVSRHLQGALQGALHLQGGIAWSTCFVLLAACEAASPVPR